MFILYIIYLCQRQNKKSFHTLVNFECFFHQNSNVSLMSFRDLYIFFLNIKPVQQKRGAVHSSRNSQGCFLFLFFFFHPGAVGIFPVSNNTLGQSGVNVIPSWVPLISSGLWLWTLNWPTSPEWFSESSQRRWMVRHWLAVRPGTEDHFRAAVEDQKLSWRWRWHSFHSQTSVK